MLIIKRKKTCATVEVMIKRKNLCHPGGGGFDEGG
jgi:hypothetical protein